MSLLYSIYAGDGLFIAEATPYSVVESDVYLALNQNHTLTDSPGSLKRAHFFHHAEFLYLSRPAMDIPYTKSKKRRSKHDKKVCT